MHWRGGAGGGAGAGAGAGRGGERGERGHCCPLGTACSHKYGCWIRRNPHCTPRRLLKAPAAAHAARPVPPCPAFPARGRPAKVDVVHLQPTPHLDAVAVAGHTRRPARAHLRRQRRGAGVRVPRACRAGLRNGWQGLRLGAAASGQGAHCWLHSAGLHAWLPRGAACQVSADLERGFPLFGACGAHMKLPLHKEKGSQRGGC